MFVLMKLRRRLTIDFEDINCRYVPIKGFSDYYITEHGDIYSTRLRGKEKEKHLHKMRPKNPGNKSKYMNIILCNATGQKTKSIHRLVAEHFIDGYFPGAVVNHIDGNNRNNDYTNLEWTTTKDNINKSYITSGLSAKRNYKYWELYDPNQTLLGVFTSHNDMEAFVKAKGLNTSPTQLTKCGRSRGYTVIKQHKEYQKL